MKIDKLTNIFFSATGTTKKIIKSISKGLNIKEIREIDLTKSNNRERFNLEFQKNELLIIGIPVYAGRVPDFLISILKKLKGNQPVILVSVYGNIDEGLALEQLKDLLGKRGFKIIGAASFIGEHSYSCKEFRIAHGRPDKQDLNQAKKFGEKILSKFIKNSNIKDIPEIKLDIDKSLFSHLLSIILPIISLPQYGSKKFIKKPYLNTNRCNHCQICVELCPMKAIDKKTLKIDDSKCIRCMSCVKNCPQEARKIEYKIPFLVKKFFELNKSNERKTPNIYL
ncbi:4Fe-4S dicluster domain-containing protein [Iocasia frigidifontis]|uniref:Ferredoxin n=1 Tax=Iocasia fonsfrigidae TaxID=2682810 RepID=A0A8A7KDR5_9FIRM|nr:MULTISPECIES: EFR1 family ferrodoxin [Halanaerobiaceae]AZO94836.1 4Fe-4S dicluster domain-containing protein [Halocella sp. SP3-1]QTL97748.1 4Fe-4S dicluster domain-containing protein [Iocasia fonsfrigidae]